MPGFRPSRKDDNDTQPEQGRRTELDFSYIKMRSSDGQVFYAMTFQQIIEFLDEISGQLGAGEESAMHHLTQIKRILRTFIKHGDGTND